MFVGVCVCVCQLYIALFITGEKYTLQASSDSQKDAWIHDIRKLLYEQACNNRVQRYIEIESMGE